MLAQLAFLKDHYVVSVNVSHFAGTGWSGWGVSRRTTDGGAVVGNGCWWSPDILDLSRKSPLLPGIVVAQASLTLMLSLVAQVDPL